MKIVLASIIGIHLRMRCALDVHNSVEAVSFILTETIVIIGQQESHLVDGYAEIIATDGFVEITATDGVAKYIIIA